MRQVIKSGLSLLFAAALTAAPAMARDRGHDRDRDRDHGRYGYHDRGDRGHDRHDRYDDRRHRHYSGYGYRDDDYYYRPAPPRVVYRPVYRPAYHPGYGPPRWARGGRYYDDGYGPTYVIRDYRGYGLRPPPRGYYWRRSDAGDFLLVAVATGIITDLILNH